MIESKIKDYGQWRMMKENLENEDAATASTQWSAELENMNYDLHTGAALCNFYCVSEIEAIEEKFEDNDVHGPNSEALWYLSLKVKKKSTTLPPPSSTTDDRKPDLESNAPDSESDSTNGSDIFDEELLSVINGERKSD